MRRLIRWFVRVIVGLVVLIAITTGAGWYWLRTSLPQLDGLIALPGLTSPVEILRDKHGIPTIRAGNHNDAAFALGFVHAQDRFAQMELMRRSGAGRLSEIIGSMTVASDRYLRGFGFYAQAQESARNLPPDFRARLQAYADGVNAWMAHHDGALPWELAVALHRPEPWTIPDSLVWGRLMTLTLTSNWRREIVRARLQKLLDDRQIEDLWPDLAGMDSGLTPDAGTGAGSNIWAVAEDRVLANDPHLGFTIPNLWYLVRIETPDGASAGATAPGLPLIVLGHNGTVAWGMTSSPSDTADLIRNPEITATRTETIVVRGGGSEQFQVRETRRGIVLSDISSNRSEPGWAIEGPMFEPDDRTAIALFELNRATGWLDILNALRDFHAPNQNVGFADQVGNVGLVSAGRIPQRPDATGFFPADRAEWSTYIPFDELPMKLNPAGGRVVNANNAVIDATYPHWIGREWAAPFRARRIEALLDQGIDHDEIQNDVVSLAARELLPHLLDAVPDPRLADWHGNMDRDRIEPLLYMAWVRETLRTVFADELGPEFQGWWSYRPAALLHAFVRNPAWCDDVTTSETESCNASIRIAHERADAFLTERYGDVTPNWGRAHKARFAHPIAGRIPLLRDLIDREIAANGGPETVNAGKMDFADESHPFRQIHGAGYRAIYSLDNLDESRFMQSVGQSANPFSPHYDDLMTLWRDGQYLSLNRPAVPTHHLVLQPQPR